jgi:uncharacterized protein (TIGR02996 family)
MSPDERALLAAVCAAPADDTPRLVYADWLDDAGRGERAEFIRCQVEAERLHPDSTRRAALEARAEQLFAANWIGWWTEVCEAVGLPLPEKPRPSRLGRLARRLWVGLPFGLPYLRERFVVGWNIKVADDDAEGFYQAEFGRGFPDRLTVTPGAAGLLRRWAAAGPLDVLDLSGLSVAAWRGLDGAHLDRLSRVIAPGPEALELRAELTRRFGDRVRLAN